MPGGSEEDKRKQEIAGAKADAERRRTDREKQEPGMSHQASAPSKDEPDGMGLPRRPNKDRPPVKPPNPQGPRRLPEEPPDHRRDGKQIPEGPNHGR